MAYRQAGLFSPAILFWSLAALILIMLATHYGGEYFDLEGDRLSAEMERNQFSGGTQVIVEGGLPHRYALIACYAALVGAAGIGLLLQFYYKTGPLTIPLGVFGMLAGVFYSMPPLRLVSRGVGEVLIGICYGWMPVALGFYLQAGYIPRLILVVALPIAFAIFNVILINEFPDYPADKQTGKRNLVVRLGKRRSALIYAAAVILSWLSFVAAVFYCVPRVALLFYLPIMVLGAVLAFFMTKGRFADRSLLEKMCGLTIAVDLGTSLAYILGFALGG
jgi:1,4-dihydroxy-2-naphthoate octaprenyltransferase